MGSHSDIFHTHFLHICCSLPLKAKEPPPQGQYNRGHGRSSLSSHFCALLTLPVKGRVKGVEIPVVQMILDIPEGFTETGRLKWIYLNNDSG